MLDFIMNFLGSLRRNAIPLSVLLRNVQLYQVACIYMPTRLFVNLSQIYIPLYLHESLHMPSTILALIPLTMFLSSFVSSLLIERINMKFGRKISYCIGVFFGVCACIWIQFGRGYTYEHYQIYLMSILLGSAGSIVLVTSLGITSDLIGQNTESGAFIYGFMSFTDKLSNGLVVMLIQYLYEFADSIDYYRDVLSYVCGCSALCGLLVTLYLKPFSPHIAYNIMDTDRNAENVDSSIVNSTTSDIINALSSAQEHVT